MSLQASCFRRQSLRRIAAVLVVLLSTLTVPTSSNAQQTQQTPCYGCIISTGQAVGILIGAAAVVTGVGVGVYFLARPSRVTGCVKDDGTGTTLQEKSSGQVYVLRGRTDLVHGGEQVKVVARKGKDNSKHALLDVKKVAKTYGSCTVQ